MENNSDSDIGLVGMGYAMESHPHFPLLTRGEGNPKKYLITPKSKKFMGPQDLLAVTALGRALENMEYRGKETGLYMSVGFIPFDEKALIKLGKFSADDQQKFSMKNFSQKALGRFNPLLTFRCLPNMPVYHCSANFHIQGPTYATYPGIGQFYQALHRAIFDLKTQKINLAIVGGCADQRNFLANHRLRELLPHQKEFINMAGFMVLQRAPQAEQDGHQILYHLEKTQLSFPQNTKDHLEWVDDQRVPLYLGPASLALFLNQNPPSLNHRGESLDGYSFQSVWRKP